MGLFPSRILASLLVLALVLPTPGAAQDPDPKRAKVPTAEELRRVDWQQVERLRNSAVGDYLQAGDLARLEKDLAASVRYGGDVGAYTDTAGYRAWWERKRGAVLRAEALRGWADKSVSEAAANLYYGYVTDTAFALEAKTPGAGQKKIDEAVESAGRSAFWLTTAGVAVGGIFFYIGKKIGDAFFFGPVTRALNSALEPVMKPVLERIDQIAAKRIAPRMVWWQKLLAGKQDTRLKSADQAVKYPGSSLEEYARYQNELWDAILPAENVSKSTMAKALKEARATGLDLLYGQFTKLSDRLQNMEVAKRSLEQHFVAIIRPELGPAFTQESLDQFEEIYRWRQDILTYEDPLSKRAATRDSEFVALADGWRKAGATQDQIEKVANYYTDLYIMDNRPAFVLVEYLEIERLRPEDNMALSKETQAWLILKRQEIGRQINGVYDVLARHRVKIERLFKAFGLNYDVMERVNERGYPFGGPGRPRNAIPMKSCIELLQPVNSQLSAK